jgi:hypothetical protein
MRFKPPGGELTAWSAIWVIFGVSACIAALPFSKWEYCVLGAVVGLPAVGMWLDQRWCGYLFAAILAIGGLLALVALVTVDDTWGERLYRGIRIAMAGYFAFISARWANESRT